MTPEESESADNVLNFLDMRTKIEALSNEEMSDGMIKVWANLRLGSIEENMLDIFITRFDKLAGIERDEGGNIIKKH